MNDLALPGEREMSELILGEMIESFKARIVQHCLDNGISCTVLIRLVEKMLLEVEYNTNWNGDDTLEKLKAHVEKLGFCGEIE